MGDILLEKVFDAGANTIWAEMKKLRGQAPEQKENMRRRWIWELIQNAFDCTPKGGKIDINVSVKNDSFLEFSHNGVPFTYENLVDLITQISSKQSESEEKTGKFGTGFISTHLISERVNIKGVFKQSGDIYKNLDFVIDRSGTSYQDIRNTIKDTLNLIEKLKQDETEAITELDKRLTKFHYNDCNSDETKEAISTGLEDLNKTAPFVLALNKSISSIEYSGIKFRVNNCRQYSDYQVVEIFKHTNEIIERFNILIKSENEVSIAALVQEIGSQKYRVLPYPNNFPKLFCKFPLVGTEHFSFPAIINCSKFEVERDRNGIHEGSQENITYLNTAVKLYDELLNYACKNEWEGIYNLCLLPKKNNSSVQESLHKTIKQKYEKLPIVDVNSEGFYSGRAALKNEELVNIIGVPICEKEEFSDNVWEIVNSFALFYIPTKETYLMWSKISESKIDISYLNNQHMKNKDLTHFNQNFHGITDDLHTWLQKYYHLWLKIKGEESFTREVSVLNQNGEFVEVSKISIDDNVDDELKKILIDLGDNITERLLVREVTIPDHIINKKTDNIYIAKKIQDKINHILSDETLNNTQRNPENQAIFNKLTNWFLENPEVSEKLFEQLYNKRNLLSTPEENIRRFRIAEKIESNNIKYEQLDDIIDNHNKIAELIENLGNLSDEEIKEKLNHISSKTTYANEKFNLILEEAVEKVYNYLNDISSYQVAHSLDEWKREKYSDTVFLGLKDGKEIRIIVRPSNQNKLIFFYEEELEALDDTNYELWTDDGLGNTRMITLGDILKTTGITVIPLKNIYNS
jgi:hypothetical protein